ncbi:MAG: hypothetical protein M3015_08920 [Bacteroidota bacterium]|nr:hypothetical protein [Bacteroidota bacterium]
MALASRPNIYNLLKKEIRIFDTLIDIGCAGLQDLVDFEYSPFKNLIGIDKYFATNAFGDYRRVKLFNKELTDEEFRLMSKELIKSFTQRFIIHIKNLFEINWETGSFSFIICNKVLHFYEEEQKFEVLQRLFNSLQPDGMIYLKVNHNLHPNNSDLEKMIRVKENVYQNKEVPEDVRYLIDTKSFLQRLQMKYLILQDYTTIDSKTLAVVLRKTMYGQ